MDPEQFTQFMTQQNSLLSQLISSVKAQTSTTSKAGGSTRSAPAPGINPNLVPNFDSFDPTEESFKTYKQRFENYGEMKSVLADKPYCARLLLNSMGSKYFDMVAAPGAPKTPTEHSYEELITLLDEHLDAQQNELVAQHKFLSTYQQFVTSLRSEIGDCNFISPCDCKVSIADKFLRAQFVRGLKDYSIRENVLQSTKTAFKDIVADAIALEASKINSRVLAPKPGGDINKINHEKKPPHSKPYKERSHSRQRVMCGVGVDIAVHNHGIGYFYVICSGVVFFLEIAWIITLFIQVCSRNEFGPCMNCWTNVLWLRLWRKSLLYVLFALILFLKPHRLWLSVVAGMQLVVLAGLYMALTYRSNQQSKVIPSPRLLNHSNSPSQEDNYDKYDDITEVLDDAMPAPLVNDSLSELDQDTILEM